MPAISSPFSTSTVATREDGSPFRSERARVDCHVGKRLLNLGFVLAAFCSACSAPGGSNELPVTDDFSDCSRWLTEDDELVSLGCVDGVYRILIKDSRAIQSAFISLSTAVEMVSVEADAAYETGPEGAGYGVSCGASEQGYLFGVSPDGTWAIVKWTDGTATNLLAESGTEDAIEGFSEANRIRGECFGGGEKPTALALHVNGKTIATIEDPDGLTSFSEVSVWVVSDEAGTEVRFDNFAARELEGALRPSSEAEAPIELPAGR